MVFFFFQDISVRGFWVMIMSQGGAPDMRQEPSTKWTALILRVIDRWGTHTCAMFSVQGLCHLMISGSVPTVCYVQQQLCTEILYDENGQKTTPTQGRKKTKVLYGVNLLRWLPIITSVFGRGADQLAELPRFEPLAGHNEGTLIVRQMHDEDTIIGIQRVETW